MTLMEIAQLLGNFGEFFGAIAVVATLIYLAIQIRQNSTQLRIVSHQTTLEKHSGLIANVLDVPENFDFERLRVAFEEFNGLLHHHKFCNNIDYQRSIHLLNKTEFIDFGHLLLIENESVFSPMGCLHFEYYEGLNDCIEKVKQHKDLQLIASDISFENSISLGETQSPRLDQYADQIDTIEFLTQLQ